MIWTVDTDRNVPPWPTARWQKIVKRFCDHHETYGELYKQSLTLHLWVYQDPFATYFEFSPTTLATYFAGGLADIQDVAIDGRDGDWLWPQVQPWDGELKYWSTIFCELLKTNSWADATAFLSITPAPAWIPPFTGWIMWRMWQLRIAILTIDCADYRPRLRD